MRWSNSDPLWDWAAILVTCKVTIDGLGTHLAQHGLQVGRELAAQRTGKRVKRKAQ